MQPTPESLGRLSRFAGGMADTTPQAAALGIRFISADDGDAVMDVPYRADLVGDPRTGVLAGGVVTTLIDHACGLAVAIAPDLKEDPRRMATLDLRIDYMRPAEPGRAVVTRARCYKVTRSIAFVRAIAYDRDAEDPIATAQAAFALIGAPGEVAPGEAGLGEPA